MTGYCELQQLKHGWLPGYLRARGDENEPREGRKCVSETLNENVMTILEYSSPTSTPLSVQVCYPPHRHKAR